MRDVHLSFKQGVTKFHIQRPSNFLLCFGDNYSSHAYLRIQIDLLRHIQIPTSAYMSVCVFFFFLFRGLWLMCEVDYQLFMTHFQKVFL